MPWRFLEIVKNREFGSNSYPAIFFCKPPGSIQNTFRSMLKTRYVLSVLLNISSLLSLMTFELIARLSSKCTSKLKVSYCLLSTKLILYTNCSSLSFCIRNRCCSLFDNASTLWIFTLFNSLSMFDLPCSICVSSASFWYMLRI